MASSEVSDDGVKPTEIQADDKEKEKESTTLQQRVQMRLVVERKAHKIVERLLDNPVTEGFLMESASSIYPQHYQDAVIERSIIKQCGYPLCQRSLGNIPKQKYHICRTSNKVYDITDRKCFCSQFCYKASKFYEAQLSESPQWTRDIDELPEVKLLTSDMDGDPTAASLVAKDSVVLTERIQPHEVDESGTSEEDTTLHVREEMLGLLEDDLTTLTLADARKERLQELSHLSRSPAKESMKQGKRNSHKTEKHECRTESTSLHVGVLPTQDAQMGTHSFKESSPKMVRGEKPGDTITHSNTDCSEKPKNLDSKEIAENTTSSSCSLPSNSEKFENATSVSSEGTKKKTKQKLKQPGATKDVSLLEVVIRVVMEWTTDETRRFVNGSATTETRPNSEVISSTGQKPNESVSLSGPDTMDTDQLLNLGKASLPPVKPLPGIKQLKEETEQFALKVQEFYYGTHVATKGKKETSKGGADKKDDSIDRSLRLPLVDSKSQMAIRRKILSDRLNRVYSEILAPLGLSVRDVSSNLRALIKTFKLSSTNITFKPAGWTLLGIVILHTLAGCDLSIQESLAQEASQRFLDSLLVMMGTNLKQVAIKTRELGRPQTSQHGNSS